MRLKPFSTTGIGSMPHVSAADASALSIKSLDIPFWPQLPNVSFREGMIPQYAEGMPCVRYDDEAEKIWFERNEEEIDRFYETAAEDNSRLAISEDSAHGISAFMKQVRSRSFNVLKGHITGPVTFTLGLKDAGGRLLYYDEELREIAVMLLKAKARWQMDLLGSVAREVVIFIDEPILSALGTSAYLGVDTEEAERMLTEAVNAVKEAGGIAGIHCCGRADWPLVMRTGVDLLNFDVYGYGDTLALYPEETLDFLKGGGALAWGIVPTSQDIAHVTEDSLVKLHRMRMEKLARVLPEDLLMERIILTPSCGTGSRTIAEATKVFQLLMRVKEAVEP